MNKKNILNLSRKEKVPRKNREKNEKDEKDEEDEEDTKGIGTKTKESQIKFPLLSLQPIEHIDQELLLQQQLA